MYSYRTLFNTLTVTAFVHAYPQSGSTNANSVDPSGVATQANANLGTANVVIANNEGRDNATAVQNTANAAAESSGAIQANADASGNGQNNGNSKRGAVNAANQGTDKNMENLGNEGQQQAGNSDQKQARNKGQQQAEGNNCQDESKEFIKVAASQLLPLGGGLFKAPESNGDIILVTDCEIL